MAASSVFGASKARFAARISAVLHSSSKDIQVISLVLMAGSCLLKCKNTLKHPLFSNRFKFFHNIVVILSEDYPEYLNPSLFNNDFYSKS